MKRPHFLFVGLGEPDEYAHRNDYARYLMAIREADVLIGKVSERLALLNAQGMRTVLFVTTDHGRAAQFIHHGQRYPESARVWLVATGSEILARGRVAAEAPRYLADLAPTIRFIAGLNPDAGASAGSPLMELVAPNRDRKALLAPRRSSSSVEGASGALSGILTLF